MIIKFEKETLQDMSTTMHGTKQMDLPLLSAKADAMQPNWDDIIVDGNKIDIIPDGNGSVSAFYDGQTSDMTEYAFGQYCNKLGVPANYMQKCIDSGEAELAITNMDRWKNRSNLGRVRVRNYDDTTRAFLTSRWQPFEIANVLHSSLDALSEPAYSGKYEANQAFLSPDKLHVRFVDFNNPIHVGNDTLHSGFTVSTNDVGAGSLNIKYFLYRFVCKNGLVCIKNGGMIYRQTHLGEGFGIGKDLFIDAFQKMDALNQYATNQITKAYNKILSLSEMEMYLSRVRNMLHLGKSGNEVFNKTLEKYDNTAWGVINAVTENAQLFSLEDRVAHETFAGELLAKVA